MKIKLIVLFLMASVSMTWGQSDSLESKRTSTKVIYSNSFMVGGLFGDDDNTFSAATNHGIRYGRLTTDLGVGYDSYRDWRAIPFYAYFSFDIAHMGKNALSISVTGGYSDCVYSPKTDLDGARNYESKDGGNYSTMLGYRIPTNQYSIYISAGYKFQRINYSYETYYWYSGSGGPSVAHVQMDMSRVAISLGIGLH